MRWAVLSIFSGAIKEKPEQLPEHFDTGLC